MAKKTVKGGKGPAKQEEVRPEEMSVWELVKAGAIILAVVVIAKILFELLVRLFGYLKGMLGRAWAIFKANTVVFVAVPLTLAVLATMFPESAGILDGMASGIRRSIDASGLHLDIPDLFSSSQQPREPTGLIPPSDLRGCTMTMEYLSSSGQDEQKCVDLCKDRGYSSYGIVKDGSAYDCYCCHGSGTLIE